MNTQTLGIWWKFNRFLFWVPKTKQNMRKMRGAWNGHHESMMTSSCYIHWSMVFYPWHFGKFWTTIVEKLKQYWKTSAFDFLLAKQFNTEKNLYSLIVCFLSFEDHQRKTPMSKTSTDLTQILKFQNSIWDSK